MSDGVIPWREVQAPPQDCNGTLRPLLATVDALRGAWKEYLGQVPPEAFAEARRRSLRRHAIETGIIERLYDVDWGVTKALVAEGLSGEVAAREGGIAEDALAVIQSQFQALEWLAAAAREGQGLTAFFIRQLHEAITRQQRTYTARDHVGNIVEATLRHGEWKSYPNHVLRPDGTLLQYVPPEQVQPQVEQLVEYYPSSEHAHPVVAAAWLHHAFISIHPFQDGNGRVARALTLLVLLRHDYAPLVVDRGRREIYLHRLDEANRGDLAPLVRLFAELEIAALRSELERPVERVPATSVRHVARAYAERLRGLQQGSAREKAAGAQALAGAIAERVTGHLDQQALELHEEFRMADPKAHAKVFQGSPDDPEHAHWWRSQLIRTAKALDFFANLTIGSWWAHLRLTVAGQSLSYVVAIQKVGHGETGVLAVTVFAELRAAPSDDDDHAQPARPIRTPAFSTSDSDSVTLVHTDEPDTRWPEVADLIDHTLAAAVASFGQQLG